MSRVALTTTTDRATRLREVCVEVGLEPKVLPCIEVMPASERALQAARDDVATSDWLVITSSRAVTSLWPEGGMPAVTVATVGSSTADAVRDAGGVPTVVGRGGAAELIDLIAGRVEGRRVAFPHGSGAGQSTVEALNAAGADVASAPVYEIRPIGPSTTEVDAVAFGSPSAVSGWFLSRDLDGIVTGAIGTTTERALAEHSVIPDVVPPRPSFDHMIGLIADRMRDRSAV